MRSKGATTLAQRTQGIEPLSQDVADTSGKASMVAWEIVIR